jgi:hypothetical protein
MTEQLRPPPTDTAWLEVQEIRARKSGWVRHASTPPHVCAPPCRDVDSLPVPDGQPGDLWRCSCGRLWQISDDQVVRDHRPGRLMALLPAWQPASRWQRIHHWRRP